MAEVLPEIQTFARIKVCGVGGGGTSAVERMISSKLQGIEFVAINTDAQSLHHSHAGHKIHIGQNLTRGLGAGADPAIGRKAAEESQKEVSALMKGADMVFITAGMGGGTGTGAAPLIAAAAREAGSLVVGIVTKPFTFEGERRMAQAEQGIDELADNVDTLITIPNDRLLDMIDRKTSLLDAFRVVDDVLQQGVQGISDLITVHGLINLDFADVKSVMQDAGSALMGIGRAKGDNRAIEAARQAIDSPLLEVSIEGAKGVLFNITGGRNMSMHEVDEAAKAITEAIDPGANIIFGAVLDETMDDDIKITVVATGFEAAPRSRTNRITTSDAYENQPAIFDTSPTPWSGRAAATELTLADETELEQPAPAGPVSSRFSSGPFIDERPAFEDDEPSASQPTDSDRSDIGSVFDEPVKPAVASIEPDPDEDGEQDVPVTKPAVTVNQEAMKPTARKNAASASAKPKGTAKSLIQRAGRALGGSGQYDEDDLDVPAFIRRKK